VKRLEREANHLSPSSAEVNNALFLSTRPLYAFHGNVLIPRRKHCLIYLLQIFIVTRVFFLFLLHVQTLKQVLFLYCNLITATSEWPELFLPVYYIRSKIAALTIMILYVFPIAAGCWLVSELFSDRLRSPVTLNKSMNNCSKFVRLLPHNVHLESFKKAAVFSE
jgi:hypothetical protein